MTTTTTARDTLLANLANLGTRDQTFAASLLGARNPSAKQTYWIEQLATRATTPKAPRATVQVGNLTAINALFDKARTHLKHPAIVLNVDDVGPIRLSVAGDKARVPGSINVATNESFGQSTWFGRVLQDGNFEASPRVPTPPTLTAKLACFAANPAKVAADHGKLTGRCCFCSRGLTDKRSTEVGYGPICAANFGLPWGE